MIDPAIMRYFWDHKGIYSINAIGIINVSACVVEPIIRMDMIEEPKKDTPLKLGQFYWVCLAWTNLTVVYSAQLWNIFV